MAARIRVADARIAYEEVLHLSANEVERAHLEGRLARLGDA